MRHLIINSLLLIITGCTQVNDATPVNNATFVKPKHETINQYEFFKQKAENIPVRSVSSKVNMNAIKSILEGFGVNLTLDNAIKDTIYDGPELNNMDAFTILEVISGVLYFDFLITDFSNEILEVTIFPNMIERINVSVGTARASDNWEMIKSVIQDELEFNLINKDSKKTATISIGDFNLRKDQSEFMLLSPKSVKQRIIKKIIQKNPSVINGETQVNGGIEIKAGTVNENIIRIASEEFGIPQANVEFQLLPCDLIEQYSYVIPPEKFTNKYERLTYYASQYSFFTTFNPMTNTVTLQYRGPYVFDKCGSSAK